MSALGRSMTSEQIAAYLTAQIGSEDEVIPEGMGATDTYATTYRVRFRWQERPLCVEVSREMLANPEALKARLKEFASMIRLDPDAWRGRVFELPTRKAAEDPIDMQRASSLVASMDVKKQARARAVR